ncbi:DUF1206 domain-containing protein [Aurantiacibacter sp. MUD11]|uniref:DUF1206 domain-containing protein n=1 Tax=Aurantiacibacter sp. MUD11 TaxID=3003265 RepID=UPI0022AADF84|nr:DUF1206 domain-containing protein [Aurantiacibacter sp. MUD11]WAT18318.1 DUF1206 domain-containing protein [Aurantiacibacter sp. MUD11]
MVDKSEKFSQLVRVGYFSRAILYSVVGLIALTSAGKIAAGTDGAFRAIEDFPAGSLVLWLMVVGLSAYGLFRLASFAFDIENQGADTVGWAKRIGHAGSGIGHFALAYAAFEFATTEGSSGQDSAQAAASGLLSMEFGGLVLGLLGLAFFLAALDQAKKGITGNFMHRILSGAPRYTRQLGTVGYLARTIVFAIIGWSLVNAGMMSGGSEQVLTLGDAVATLAGNGAVFTLVAIGMIAFGLLSLILARYRCIPDLDPEGRIPSFRA